MPESYLPSGDADLVVWLNNFQVKLAGYAATFGLVAADTTALTNDYNAFAYMVNQVELAKVNVQDRVAYKDLLKNGPIGAVGGAFPGAFAPPAVPAVVVATGVFPRVRLLVKRLKAHPNYTRSLGEDLGIVRASSSGVVPKPKGSAHALAGAQVEIKFVKGGHPGVIVESKRGSEAGWSLLGTYLRSPFVDSRPLLVSGQPEVRSYRMRYARGNDPIGDPSDTLTVTTLL